MKIPLIRLTLLLLADCSPPSAGNVPEAATSVATGAAVATPAAVGDTARPTAVPSPAADQGDDGLTTLAGRWKVAAVHVKPSDVQALSENDPTNMGAVLEIARDRMAWQPHDGGSFSDVCVKPRLTLDGQVSCSTGQFGPPGARLLPHGDEFQLDWYDGGTLVLKRLSVGEP